MARKKILTVTELTSKAGKSRMASLTPKERSDLGRQGGLVGGKARAATLSAKRRSEIARQAVLARWAKRNQDQD
ncbi:MAG: hypothetical protein KIT09_10285 [Bryobacteraceae bacterium]|nr:hypothetical protein [Bryobacteraceae bacterium]